LFKYDKLGVQRYCFILKYAKKVVLLQKIVLINMKRVISLLSIVLGLFSCVEVKSNLNFATADSIINASIADSIIPGAVLCVVDNQEIVYLQAYGNRRDVPIVEAMTTNTIFDLASVSKPLGAGTAMLLLCADGKANVNNLVSQYIPNYHTDVQIRHLMTHYSGLPAYMNANRLDSIFSSRNIHHQDYPSYMIDTIARCKRPSAVGEKYRYSCLNFISLQRVVESIVGMDINRYLRSTLYSELGVNMGWLPDTILQGYIAPTECLDSVCLHGEVHDPLARMIMNGVSGNAGLFATAEDVAKWSIWFMQLPPEVRENGCQAGLWTDTVSTSYGEQQRCRHTGYTGTSVTIMPQLGRAVILLTNRVHPKDEHSLGDLRSKLNEWLIP
jgi:CubicO group peptidase (beta-lactamase class C family)